MRSFKLCTMITPLYIHMSVLGGFGPISLSRQHQKNLNCYVPGSVLKLEFEKLIKAMFSSFDRDLSRHNSGSMPYNVMLFVCMIAVSLLCTGVE